MFQKKFLFLVVSFFIFHSVAFGTPHEFAKEPPVVVTALRTNILEERVTKSTTVITEEMLEESNVATVAEAVRSVPGVFLRNTGGIGRVTSVLIRGGAGNQTLVLFDGVQTINSPTVGSADMASFFQTGIEQVEIIRGSTGVLHGSGAQSGLINLVTKRGRGPAELKLWGEFGSNRTFRETASLSGSFRPESGVVDEFYYSFANNRVDSDSIGTQNDYENWYHTMRVGADLTDQLNFDLVSRLYNSSVGTDTINFSSEPVGITDSYAKDRLLTIKPQLNFVTDAFESHLAYSGSFQRYYSVSRGSFSSESRQYIRSQKLDWYQTLHTTQSEKIESHLTFGIDYKSDYLNNRDIASTSKTQNRVRLFGAYVQEEVRLFDQITLIGGVRLVDHSLFGTETVYSAAASYDFESIDAKLKANFDSSFKAPTLNDLFFSSPFTQGNLSLRPENGSHYDIGFEKWCFERKVKTGVTYFYNDFNNLITYQFDPNTFLSTPVNSNSVEIHGVESELNFECSEKFSFFFNHTWTDSRDARRNNKELQLIARNMFNLGCNWKPHDMWNVNFDVTFASVRRQDFVPYQLSPYAKADMSVTFEPKDGIETYLRIDNLFNDDYQNNPGFPQPGFQAFIGAKITFGGQK